MDPHQDITATDELGSARHRFDPDREMNVFLGESEALGRQSGGTPQRQQRRGNEST
jgi:hypothetical protein